MAERPQDTARPTPPTPAFTAIPAGADVAGPTYGVVPSLPDWPASANLATNGQLGAGGPYMGWGQTITVSVDTGLACNATQGPKGYPQDPVRVHGGKAVKVIQGVAIRLGGKPQVPSSDTGSNNDVLVRKAVATFNQTPMPDGSPVYGVVWLFVYEMQAPPADGDSYQFSRSPLYVGPVDALNPADFSSYMNTPAPAVTSNYPIPPVTF